MHEEQEQEQKPRRHRKHLRVQLNMTAPREEINYNPDLEAPTVPLWWSRRELAFIQKRCRDDADSYCQSRPGYIESMIEVLKECRDESKEPEHIIDGDGDEYESDEDYDYDDCNNHNSLDQQYPPHPHQQQESTTARSACCVIRGVAATEHECALGNAGIRGLESRAFRLLRLARKKHAKTVLAIQGSCRDWEVEPDYTAYMLSVQSQRTSQFCRVLAVKLAAGDRNAATAAATTCTLTR
jgi:hypothetical protein